MGLSYPYKNHADGIVVTVNGWIHLASGILPPLSGHLNGLHESYFAGLLPQLIGVAPEKAIKLTASHSSIYLRLPRGGQLFTMYGKHHDTVACIGMHFPNARQACTHISALFLFSFFLIFLWCLILFFPDE